MPTQAQKGVAGIAPTHSKTQRYKGVGNQRHAPAALPPGKPVPIVQEATKPCSWRKIHHFLV
jgi:hypothetical protein